MDIDDARTACGESWYLVGTSVALTAETNTYRLKGVFGARKWQIYLPV